MISELTNPPITEVVCGFILNPTPLTTLDFGVYREMRVSDFQRSELHPPVMDGVGFQLGPMIDARVWLISHNEELLVQLQGDRVYVNWRRRGEHYPRFHDHGEQNGIKRQAIDEYKKFASFAKSRGIENLSIVRLELAKINILKKGIDYKNTSELCELIRFAGDFERVCMSSLQQFELRFIEGDQIKSSHVAISMTQNQVQLEIRHTFPFSDDLDSAFSAANELVNKQFFNLLDVNRLEEIRL
ncbi:hypothetical protein HW932_19945 [Allochromatium humboldtianum]|uniref:TIGR04255 family protein n=1 Tax=Allochromatium humboldtianum TaxID=504901 RepID=A0A850RH67_9GAMM|nr:hypothetical protein [Allochromatium humboldtianum]NVZ11526.1 hypothetical protein [Allochromatium humboldtianum]